MNGQLDSIYEEIDSLMHAGDLAAIDNILKAVNIKETDTVLLIGYLTFTLPVRSKLIYRELFYHNTEKVLRERGELKDGILHGLSNAPEIIRRVFDEAPKDFNSTEGGFGIPLEIDPKLTEKKIAPEDE